MTKIAFTTHEKVLVELRSALRGDEFNKNEFIKKIKIMDEIIIDRTPLADKYIKKSTIRILNNIFYLIKMIQTIITYVNFNFPFYNDVNYNECFIKSCLVYKYLCDTYFKKKQSV